jgi:hypothetical protein
MSVPSLRSVSSMVSADELSEGAAAVSALSQDALAELLDFSFPGLQLDPPAADAVPRGAPADQIDFWASKFGVKSKVAKAAAKLVGLIREGAITNVLPAEAISEDCTTLGLPESHVAMFAKCWRERGMKLCSTAALAKHALRSIFSRCTVAFRSYRFYRRHRPRWRHFCSAEGEADRHRSSSLYPCLPFSSCLLFLAFLSCS